MRQALGEHLRGEGVFLDPAEAESVLEEGTGGYARAVARQGR